MRKGKLLKICTAVGLFALLMVGSAVHPIYTARHFLSDGKFSEAETAINHALENSLLSSDPTLYLERANARRYLKNWKGAHEDLEQALKLQQGNWLLYGFNSFAHKYLAHDIHLQQAYVYVGEAQVAKAIEECDQAIKTQDSYLARSQRALLNEDNKNFQNAEADYNQAVKLAYFQDEEVNSLTARAEFLLRQSKFDDAIKDMDKVIYKDKTAYSYDRRGVMKIAKGDQKSALDDFNEALALQPEYKEALDHKAECQGKLGSK